MDPKIAAALLAAVGTMATALVWVTKRITTQAFSHTIPRLQSTFEKALGDVVASSERRETILMEEIRLQRRELLDEMRRRDDVRP